MFFFNIRRIASYIGIIILLIPNYAFSNGINIVFDQEIQDYIEELSIPILKVAGINPLSVSYYIVYDNSINAFVTGGQNIFVNTGLINNATNSDQIQGVLAHEIGHIAAGHLVRSQSEYTGGGIPTAIGVLGGLGALIAGGPVGFGSFIFLSAGGMQVDFARAQAFTRVQENSADQMAVTYLDSAQLSSVGLLQFMQILASSDRTDRRFEWAMSHPITQDRVNFVYSWVQKSKYSNNMAPQSENDKLKAIQAKISAFAAQNTDAQLIVPKKGEPYYVWYGYANRLFFRNDLTLAKQVTSNLIEQYPNIPYLYELMGDITFALGQYKESEAAYTKATEIEPTANYYYLQIARAQMALNTKEDYKKALVNLEKASNNSVFFRSPTISRQMAIVYGHLNMTSYSKLSLAEAFYAEGNRGRAVALAKEASIGFKQSSPEWIRAQDIISLSQ